MNIDVQAFGPSFLRINCFPFALIWSFSFLRLFLTSFFKLFCGATQMDLDGLGSCASRSDSLISLSYLMAVFSTKSFGLLLMISFHVYYTSPGNGQRRHPHPSTASSK